MHFVKSHFNLYISDIKFCIAAIPSFECEEACRFECPQRHKIIKIKRKKNMNISLT